MESKVQNCGASPKREHLQTEVIRFLENPIRQSKTLVKEHPNLINNIRSIFYWKSFHFTVREHFAWKANCEGKFIPRWNRELNYSSMGHARSCNAGYLKKQKQRFFE
ncbi:hypothetical protein AVEN_98632-1 [Araneus ventricosus]|uniref:Uncharacterized protein n=1 Tax=Araneus ventricosus TaxID=182803 RepID=A0A4Y2QUK0_ARAVE|nr:hypothetical protein AVEN_98632-1 [Araneus ventricosus]